MARRDPKSSGGAPTQSPDDAIATPAPSGRLHLTLTRLRQGEGLHRVHQEKCRADQFNPGVQGNARFSPILDGQGNPIPTIRLSRSASPLGSKTMTTSCSPAVFWRRMSWVMNSSANRVLPTRVVPSTSEWPTRSPSGRLTSTSYGSMPCSRRRPPRYRAPPLDVAGPRPAGSALWRHCSMPVLVTSAG